MSLESQYNLRSPGKPPSYVTQLLDNITRDKYLVLLSPKKTGVKRLMREALELAKPTEEYYASPLDDNLFEWHFTVRGPSDTEFEGGFYHGRILLPPQYPMQPPNIILLTVSVLSTPQMKKQKLYGFSLMDALK